MRLPPPPNPPHSPDPARNLPYPLLHPCAFALSMPLSGSVYPPGSSTLRRGEGRGPPGAHGSIWRAAPNPPRAPACSPAAVDHVSSSPPHPAPPASRTAPPAPPPPARRPLRSALPTAAHPPIASASLPTAAVSSSLTTAALSDAAAAAVSLPSPPRRPAGSRRRHRLPPPPRPSRLRPSRCSRSPPPLSPPPSPPLPPSP